MDEEGLYSQILINFDGRLLGIPVNGFPESPIIRSSQQTCLAHVHTLFSEG